ncbi:MAG: hypothetical protein AB1792_07195 [Candidatus Zixiibacteriota bacterium]
MAFVLALLAVVAASVGGPWICVLDDCCDDPVCTDAFCGHCTCATTLLLPGDQQILPQWSQTGLLTPEGETTAPPEPAFGLYRPPRFSLA